MDNSHADGYPCDYYEKNVKCNLVTVLTDPVIVRNNSGNIRKNDVMDRLTITKDPDEKKIYKYKNSFHFI